MTSLPFSSSPFMKCKHTRNCIQQEPVWWRGNIPLKFLPFFPAPACVQLALSLFCLLLKSLKHHSSPSPSMHTLLWVVIGKHLSSTSARLLNCLWITSSPLYQKRHLLPTLVSLEDAPTHLHFRPPKSLCSEPSLCPSPIHTPFLLWQFFMVSSLVHFSPQFFSFQFPSLLSRSKENCKNQKYIGEKVYWGNLHVSFWIARIPLDPFGFPVQAWDSGRQKGLFRLTLKAWEPSDPLHSECSLKAENRELPHLRAGKDGCPSSKVQNPRLCTPLYCFIQALGGLDGASPAGERVTNSSLDLLKEGTLSRHSQKYLTRHTGILWAERINT